MRRDISMNDRPNPSTDSLGNPRLRDPNLIDCNPAEIYQKFNSEAGPSTEPNSALFVSNTSLEYFDPSSVTSPIPPGKRSFSREFQGNQPGDLKRKYSSSDKEAFDVSSFSLYDQVDGSYEDDSRDALQKYLNSSMEESDSESGTDNSMESGNQKRTHHRKKPLTEQEKVSAKEKNREHARNTRMRKKNYIESLKDTIKALNDDREKLDRERRVAFNRMNEQINVRRKVLQDTLTYHSAGLLDSGLWSTLLDEKVTFVFPVTPYRSFPPLDVFQGQRYIRGIQAVIQDTASIFVLLQSIVPPINGSKKMNVGYFCKYDEAVLEDEILMCKYDMSTLNAVELGCRHEIQSHGMIKVRFTTLNKIIHLEIMFDVMSFMQQLRRASGRSDFIVIPNTPFLAQDQAPEPRIVTEALPPFRIVYVNEAWERLFRFRRDQVLGKTCKILQGEYSEKDKIDQLMQYIRNFLPFSTVITNYTQTGESFPNWIRVYPLYTENTISHFLGIMENLQYLAAPALRVPPVQSFYHLYSPASSNPSLSSSSGSHHSAPNVPLATMGSYFNPVNNMNRMEGERSISSNANTTTNESGSSFHQNNEQIRLPTRSSLTSKLYSNRGVQSNINSTPIDRQQQIQPAALPLPPSISDEYFSSISNGTSSNSNSYQELPRGLSGNNLAYNHAGYQATTTFSRSNSNGFMFPQVPPFPSNIPPSQSYNSDQK